MSKSYDDARFGANKILAAFPISAALNGTAASSAQLTLASKLIPYKSVLNVLTVRFPVGGTAATLQLVVGTATPFAAGTMGAIGAIGTFAVGTLANETDLQFTLAGTVQAGDAIILTTYGTTTAVYTAQSDVWGQELFANL